MTIPNIKHMKQRKGTKLTPYYEANGYRNGEIARGVMTDDWDMFYEHVMSMFTSPPSLMITKVEIQVSGQKPVSAIYTYVKGEWECDDEGQGATTESVE